MKTEEQPFYEGNLFLGILSLVATCVMTAFGLIFSSGTLAEVLLFGAWLASFLCFYLAWHKVRPLWKRLLTTILCWFLVGMGLFVAWTKRTRQPLQVAIESPLPSGNLNERALVLSRTIMENLYEHGWPPPPGVKFPEDRVIMQMPNGPKASLKWAAARSEYFRYRFLGRVTEIRDEFAQLHMRDTVLDQILESQKAIESANQELRKSRPGVQPHPTIQPQEIAEVAHRLQVLAEQIEQRRSPQPLEFSEKAIDPALIPKKGLEGGYAYADQFSGARNEQFPNGTETTITTNRVIRTGYVVLQFDGRFAIASSDLSNSISTIPSELAVDKDLSEYLKDHWGTTYAIGIGQTAFSPQEPIHVFTKGRSEIRTVRVTLFDEVFNQ